MRVIVGCEFSGRVRDAFIREGHDAWSCDLLPSESSFGPHHQGDVLEFARSREWDMGIFFPPCTYLCSSGLHWNKRVPGRALKSVEALGFVRALLALPIPKLALENPVGLIGTQIRPADQWIDPWMFGHAEQKHTGLWLRNLPKLVPTKMKRLPRQGYWKNQTPSGQSNVPPGETRWMQRSRTYLGVADAFAKQWGRNLL